MKTTRLWIAALLGTAAAAVLACRDPSPLDPAPRGVVPETLLGEPPVFPTGLLVCSPLPYDSVTQTIGAEGGTLQVGPHTLSVPPGALDSAVTITAVAPSDTANHIRFQPEGLTFLQSADLTMSYANCDLLGLHIPKRIAYTTDLLQILEYLQSVDNPTSQTITGRLEHFSEYAVAW